MAPWIRSTVASDGGANDLSTQISTGDYCHLGVDADTLGENVLIDRLRRPRAR